jgi:hypothetical protein
MPPEYIEVPDLRIEYASSPITEVLIQESCNTTADSFLIVDSGTLKTEGSERFILPRRYPFGTAEQLSRSDLIQPDRLSVLERQTIARKILWNSASIWWRRGDLEASFNIALISGDQRSLTTLSGEIQREYPRAAREDGALFVEEVVLRSPKFLDGWQLEANRQFANAPDTIFISSPASGNRRMVEPENRIDGIFGLGFSVEDLLGWSPKIEDLDPQFDGMVLALAPSFKQKFSGLVEVVPKRLWRVTIKSRSPMTTLQKQVAYFDPETQLILMRFDFNRTGRLISYLFYTYGSNLPQDKIVCSDTPQHWIPSSVTALRVQLPGPCKLKRCPKVEVARLEMEVKTSPAPQMN